MVTVTATRAPRRWAPSRQDVVHAVVLFGLGSVLYALGTPPIVTVRGDPVVAAPDWVRLITLGAICAAELLRTKAPVLGLACGLVVATVDAFLGFGLGVLLALGDLLYSATLNGSRRTSRVIVGVVGSVILGSMIASLVLVDDFRRALLIALQLCTIPLIPVWWAMNVRQQREVASAERARADQLGRIAELDRKAAVAAERSRMARDLHDVIAGHLSAIAIQSEAVLCSIGLDGAAPVMVDGDPDTMRAVLKAVRENSVASLTEMRAMIGLLRAEEGEDALTAPARLRDLEPLLSSARAAGLQVSVTTEVEPALPVAVDLSAYRIVQEALTNAVKHSPGGRAEVTVGRENGKLVIEVTNERLAGSGPEVAGDGTGLVSMRERAEAVGGVLVAGPYDGGWRVRAELPVEVERDA